MIADDDVATFVAMTGASAEEAQSYLEMAGGDLQGAINLFLEMGHAPAAPVVPPTAPRPAVASAEEAVVDADVAAEVAAAAAAAGIDAGPLMQDAAMGAGGGDTGEVRAPIAAYQDQIINPEHERRRVQEAIQADSSAMARRMTFDRPADDAGAATGGGDAGGQAINQLFAAPEYNETHHLFEQVVEKAKTEGKWILVNIQQAEVFASHALNRDVWSDDTIKDILIGSFLFWQRDDKSAEGERFCQLYKCGHQLPHICVVDPRTARRVKSWDGRKWVEAHAAAEYLFGFLDEFSMSRSPPATSPAASPCMQPSAPPSGLGEDLQLIGLDDGAGAADVKMPDAKDPPAEMPEEPPPDSAEHLKVSLRLPSGQTVKRRFLPGDPLDRMFDVASALAQETKSCIHLSTQFPKRTLRDIDGGLQTSMKDAKVAGDTVWISVKSS